MEDCEEQVEVLEAIHREREIEDALRIAEEDEEVEALQLAGDR